ncbi:hypothetical protein F2P81_020341 [Scophthalmus maximus]|uniref:Methylated-DNA--protein-cysteine methyltransferase n=1 Tax=Scophthalmus maximus TaxID=52904 RepID=A0A6A4S7Q8_SCOMX|nr:hypothetical protein F2P81_020341 [Scophthalmus maximus]
MGLEFFSERSGDRLGAYLIMINRCLDNQIQHQKVGDDSPRTLGRKQGYGRITVWNGCGQLSYCHSGRGSECRYWLANGSRLKVHQPLLSLLPFSYPSRPSSSSQPDIIWPVNGTLLCLFLSGRRSRCHEQPQHWSLHKQGSEMKKQRESQCTQKTISLLSPLGTIQVSGCENGVHTIQILMDVAPAERSSEAPLSCVVNDSPAEMSPELRRCVEWLQAYFSEPQTTGSLPLPAFHHPALQGDAFTSRVLHVLQKDVKFGETVSYKRLAEMAGNPRAVRAVGGAMRRNPLTVKRMYRKLEAGSLSPQLLIQIQSQIVSVNYLSEALLHSGFSCEKLSVFNRSSRLCGTSSSPGFEY